MRPDPQPGVRDPLAAYMAGAFLVTDKRPIPLVDTRFVVRIDAGLAEVRTTRIFRNAEDKSIEVTITFPVPVHAILFGLSARIGDHRLVARARQRAAARRHYEAAVDNGRTAVLHEEVLKGVHMLSIAHVPPGAEIAVETNWVLPLSVVAGKGRLRIPLTVGDIYGRSPLGEADDLVSGGPQLTGRLSLEAGGQKISLHGRPVDGSEITVPLNRPIDIAVPIWVPRERRATASDRSAFAVTIAPAPASQAAIDLAVLVDHSGSMDAMVSLVPGKVTKHQAVKRALAVAAKTLSAADRLALWEFDNDVGMVGVLTGPRSGRPVDLSAIDRLSDPAGGTEIGRALQHVIGEEPGSDILVITDGKSHALDVTALSRHRRRVSVLLVGEDSLEANVGHLAGLTGGDIFVASGERFDDTMAAAMASLRSGPGLARAGEVQRSGAVIAWRRAPETPDDRDPMNDALVALAVGLEIRDVPEEQAAELAERYGLVTHLTSLVLVDEEGEVQAGLPALRKVLLPGPATECEVLLSAIPRAACSLALEDAAGPPDRMFMFDRRNSRQGAGSPGPNAPRPSFTLVVFAVMLDWTADPAGLADGDEGALVTRRSEDQPRFDELFARLVARESVEALAREIGKSAVQVAILVLACAARQRERTADRLLRQADIKRHLARLQASAAEAF